jgi:hypothetical protein
MKRSELDLWPGPGGWVYVDWGNGRAWIRFGLDEHNKLTHVTEVHVADEPTTEKLRQIPLGRIGAAVSANAAVQLPLAIGRKEKLPPDFLSAPPKNFGELVEKHKPRYRLKRPASRRLDDGFFENVARAYRDALSRGLKPRQALAADTGAARDTVAGWILQSRRRGYLPPAPPGKAIADAKKEEVDNG